MMSAERAPGVPVSTLAMAIWFIGVVDPTGTDRIVPLRAQADVN